MSCRAPWGLFAPAGIPLILAFGAGCGGSSTGPTSGGPSGPGGPGQPPPGNGVPPTVTAELTNPGDSVLRVPGDTVMVLVTATDDIAIGWFGWRADPPLGGADSVQTRGAHSASAVLQIPVGAGAVGKSRVTVWARDCSDLTGRCDPAEPGNRVEQSIGSIEVVPLTPHTVHDLPLAGWTWETAYDATRQALYFSVRELGRVDVLSLSSLTWQPSIAMPAPPGALDLTPGGDTLVVGFRGAPLLGVVDLDRPVPAADTVRLTADPSYENAVWELKVTANRRVLVTLGTYLASLAQPLLEYDLTTGTQRARSDVGYRGLLADRSRVIRSYDRSRFLVAEADVCCPVQGYVYDAATDAFAPPRPIAVDFTRELWSDQAGDRYLIANGVFDRDLNLEAVADPDQFGWEFGWNPAQAISPDGAVLYFATRYGYVAIDAVTGAVRERVRLPAPPAHLFATPDGHRLVARTDRTPIAVDPPRVYVVDLP